MQNISVDNFCNSWFCRCKEISFEANPISTRNALNYLKLTYFYAKFMHYCPLLEFNLAATESKRALPLLSLQWISFLELMSLYDL